MITYKIFLPAALLFSLAACQKETSTESTQPQRSVNAASTPNTQSKTAVDHLFEDGSSKNVRSQPGTATVEGTSLVATGKGGFLMFGPYISFAPGHYELKVKGAVQELPAGTAVTFDVASRAGANIHFSQAITKPQASGEIISAAFELMSGVQDLEVRARVPDGAKITVDSYEIMKSK